MKNIKRCEFNMGTGCVEPLSAVGVGLSHLQRPAGLCSLILNGDVEAYLHAVTEYKPYEN